MSHNPMDKRIATTMDVWYRDGLRFSCDQCGSCCRYSGPVWITQREIRQISLYLEITENDFQRAYLKVIEGQLSIEKGEDGNCIMLETKANQCRIYKVRPRQCSSFPFWTDILKNQVTWAKEGTLCPGINSGRLWTCKEVHEMYLRDMKEDKVLSAKRTVRIAKVDLDETQDLFCERQGMLSPWNLWQNRVVPLSAKKENIEPFSRILKGKV